MNKEFQEIRSETTTFLRWVISGLIDSVFLIIWVFTQWLTNSIINNLNLSNIDKWVLIIFQILFAASTLAPVIVYIYVDVRIMILRAQSRIALEIAVSENSERANSHPENILGQANNKEG
jgi:ABC-type transport system involved in Fe-S cluster assembly fused permease/ATPase subunit